MKWIGGGLGIVVLLLSACASRATVDPTTLAWWIEDSAHGLPRRIEELMTTPPPSPELLTFLSGNLANGLQQPPLQIARRAVRRSALQRAFKEGRLRLHDGEVGPEPQLRGTERRLAEDLADAENGDRRTIDVLVMSLAGLDEENARRYRDVIQGIRTRQDLADGGKPWTSTP